LILLSSIPILDTQAKDRLTGAVILVALVVLLVPELLSGPGPKRATVAANASEGQPLRSYTVELGDESRTHGTAAASAATAAPPVVAAAPTATSANAPPPRVPSETAPPAAAPPLEAHAGAVVSRPRPEAAPEPTPVTGWMIQLGSFASRPNAERLVHELKTKGFPAFLTESANGARKLYRVRVGPAADHATAQALAAKLRAAGHPGSLTPHP
jgi:DedD protein